MTYQNEFTLPEALLEQVSTDGLSGMPDLLGLLLNTAMPDDWQSGKAYLTFTQQQV